MRSVILFGEMFSGKTTIANELVKLYGYRRVLNAGNIKELAAKVYNGGYPIDKAAEYTITDPTTSAPTKVSGRQLLQGIGQSVKTFDRDFWLRWFLSDIDRDVVIGMVVDDGRFPFEADAMRERGWFIVRVATPEWVRMERAELLTGRRPTIDELKHPTETLLDEIDYDLIIPGTGDAEAVARTIVSSLRANDLEWEMLNGPSK